MKILDFNQIGFLVEVAASGKVVCNFPVVGGYLGKHEMKVQAHYTALELASSILNLVYPATPSKVNKSNKPVKMLTNPEIVISMTAEVFSYDLAKIIKEELRDGTFTIEVSDLKFWVFSKTRRPAYPDSIV